MSDTSTNLSKKKREHLLGICSKIKNKEEVSIVEVTELEQFVKSMKYGLNFEQHEEEVDVMLRTHIPVFKEFKEIINNPDSSDCNFLLEGDNLHSLKLLERTHKGRIDVIYIDPPYNTLNDDFVYGDTMLDENDGFKHSKWLSFMRERLEIARKLLSNDGVIFISIDDREQAQLKLLCDSIFGEENQIGHISVVNNLKGRSDDKFFATANEFLFVYCKNREKAIINGFPLDKEKKSEYKFSDEVSKYKLVGLKKTGKNSYKEDRPNMYYPIYYSPSKNILSLSNDYLDNIEILPRINGRDGRWRWGRDTFLEKVSTELVCQKNKKGEYIIYVKMRDIVDGEKRTLKPKTVWINPQYDSGSGTGMMKDIFGDNAFTNPKPLKYIKDIIYIATAHKKENSIILDFFAGSGTTAQAVLELNEEDGGNRHFILCTNNEVPATKTLEYIKSKGYMADVKVSGKNKLIQSGIDKFFEKNPEVYQELMIDNEPEYESYGICESVTLPRIKTVITGIKPDGSKYSDGIKANLLYFKSDMIDKEDEDIDELLHDASFCLAELEHMTLIDDVTICIAECDEDVDDIIENADDKLDVVFIADDVLLDNKQKEFFERKDITIKRIPNYYYREI